MKRLFRYLSAILILSVATTSCVKPDDDTSDNPILGEDQVKWVYSLSTLLGSEIVDKSMPAFDSENNGYYLVEIDATAGSATELNDAYVVALDKTGTLLWQTKIAEAPESDLNESYLAYADGKIVVSTYSRIICLNAQSGAQNWSIDSPRTYWVNSMSVAQGKVFFVESSWPEKLVGFNLEDGSEICSISLNKTGEDIRGEATLISGSKVFVSVSDINNNNGWYSGLYIFDINSLNNVLEPTHAYTTPPDYYPASSCLISSAANTALFLAKYQGSENQPGCYLISVNEGGNENWKAEVPEEVTQLFTDAQGNIYAQGSDYLLKFSPSGAKLYQTSIPFATYFDELEITESNVFYGVAGNPETGEELNLFATFSLSTGAELLRKTEYFPYAQMEGSSLAVNEENNSRLGKNASFASGKKVIDAEGNVISISSNNIYCLKDPNQKLMTGAWAKRNGTLGNTNAW